MEAGLLTSAVLGGSCGPGDEFKINEQIVTVSPVSPPNNEQRRTDIPSTQPAGSS